MSKKILLIEDDPHLSRLYEKKFQDSGFEISLAFDGEEGFKKAGQENPDLIVTDIMLPKLDGINLFKKLRAGEKTSGLPVLFLTSFFNQDAIADCLNSGAVDYMLKNEFGPQEIVDKVKGLLEK